MSQTIEILLAMLYEEKEDISLTTFNALRTLINTSPEDRLDPRLCGWFAEYGEIAVSKYLPPLTVAATCYSCNRSFVRAATSDHVLCTPCSLGQKE